MGEAVGVPAYAAWAVAKGNTALLDYLDAAEMPDDLDLPGSGYHGLTGDMVGRYALTVSRNWRITFAWSEKSAVDIDMEDYHG